MKQFKVGDLIRVKSDYVCLKKGQVVRITKFQYPYVGFKNKHYDHPHMSRFIIESIRNGTEYCGIISMFEKVSNNYIANNPINKPGD